MLQPVLPKKSSDWKLENKNDKTKRLSFYHSPEQAIRALGWRYGDLTGMSVTVYSPVGFFWRESIIEPSLSECPWRDILGESWFLRGCKIGKVDTYLITGKLPGDTITLGSSAKKFEIPRWSYIPGFTGEKTSGKLWYSSIIDLGETAEVELDKSELPHITLYASKGEAKKHGFYVYKVTKKIPVMNGPGEEKWYIRGNLNLRKC